MKFKKIICVMTALLSSIGSTYGMDQMGRLAGALRDIAKSSTPKKTQPSTQTTTPAPTKPDVPGIVPIEEDPLITESVDIELAKQSFGQKIEIVPTQITLPPQAKISLNIPRIGLVEFVPILDKKGVVKGFQSAFPQKPLDWGLLKIEKGLFQIANGKISYNAYATLTTMFGSKRAKVGLKEFALVEKDAAVFEESAKTGKPIQVYKATLGFEFLDGALSLELIPGKKIETKTLDLILEEKKGIQSRMTSDVFGLPITVDGDLDLEKKTYTLKGVVTTRPLVDVIPEIKGTPFEGLSTDGTFEYRTLLRPLTEEEKKNKVQQHSLIFQGNIKRPEAAEGAAKPIPFLGITMQDATLSFDTTKKFLGIKFVSDVLGQPITFDGDLDFKKKEFVFKGTAKSRLITEVIPELKGTAVDGLATDGQFVLQVMTRKLTDEEKKAGMQPYALFFKGNLRRADTPEGSPQPISILGVTLKEASLFVDTTKKQAYVSGKSEALNLRFLGYFAVFFGAKKGVKFAVEVEPTQKEWKPFTDSPIEPLRDLAIFDLKGGVRAEYVAAEKGKKEKPKAAPKAAQQPAPAAPAAPSATPPGEKPKAPEPAAPEQPKQPEEAEKKPLPPLEKITFGTPEEFENAKKGVGTLESYFAGVDDLQLEGDAGARIEFYIMGKSKVLNIESEVIIKVDKAPKKNFGATLIAQLINFKLSRLFPDAFKVDNPNSPEGQAKKTLLDAIDLFKLEYARIAASTREDKVGDETILPGFNIMAEISLDAPSDNKVVIALKDVISKATGGDNKLATLQLFGNFNPADPKNINLKVALGAGSLGFNLGPARFDGARLYLVIKGEPAVGFGGGFKLTPMPGEQPLEFDLEFTATPVGFVGSGSMKNTWKEPFGIKGFEFGNLALRGSQTWSVIAEAVASVGVALLIPATLGISGDVRIGKGSCEGDKASDANTFCSKLRLNIGKDIKELAVVLDVDNPHASIVNLFGALLGQMGGGQAPMLPLDKLLPIMISKGKIYFVPLGTNIGTITVKQGLGLALYLNIMGQRDAAFMDFMLSLQEIVGKGKMRAFEIGPIKFTNYDDSCDLAKGTFKTPPALPPVNPADSLAVVRQEPQKVCGPEIDVTLSLEKEPRFVIDGSMSLLDLFRSKTKWFISKEGIGFDTETHVGPADAKLGLRLKGTSIPFNDLNAIAKLEAKDLFLEIEFQDNLTQRIRNDIARELQQHKEKLEKEVNAVIEQVGRDTVLKDLEEQQQRLNNAWTRRQEINYWDGWPKNVAEWHKRDVEWIGEKIKYDVLKIKFDIEQTKFGQDLKKIAQALGLDKLASGVLDIFKRIGVGGIEGGQFVLREVSKLATIQRAYWKGTAQDLAEGNIPGINLVMCVGCQEINQTTAPFNLRDPLKSIDAIAKTAFSIIEKTLVATIKGGPCTPGSTCAAPLGAAAAAPQASACQQLEEHINYWKINGHRDEDGIVYEGDWKRREMLVEGCRREDPARAAALELQLLPGDSCKELARHVRYWAAKGVQGPQGERYDGDPRKGRAHLEGCVKENTAVAQQLAARMLPPLSCLELFRHREYWLQHGGIDKDPKRRAQLIQECRAGNPQLAQDLERTLPPVA